MKKITSILILTAVLIILVSCSEIKTFETTQGGRVLAPEEIEKIQSDTLSDDKITDIRNLYYQLYNMNIPMLYVELPEVTKSAKMVNFLKNEFVDTLDISLKDNDTEEIVKGIVDLMPEYYSLLINKPIENIKADEKDYKVRAYGSNGTIPSEHFTYDKLKASINNFLDCKSVTLTCDSDYGVEAKVMIVHNLKDLTILTLLADKFGTVSAYNANNYTDETVISEIRDNDSYDLCITLLDPYDEYPPLNKGKDIENLVFQQENAVIPVKDNNRILQVTYQPLDDNILEAYLTNMENFRDDVYKAGTEVMFVQAPFKVLQGVTVLPEGEKDYSNQNADNFLSGLDDMGIKYIDLRVGITDEVPFKDIFFKTDHHWKPQAAFWAYTKIINMMRDDWGWDVNTDNYFTDPKNFVFESRPHDFLAHIGKELKHNFVGYDEFTLIYPNFDTNYKYKLNNNGDIAVKTGTYFEVLFEHAYLAGDDPTAYNRYGAYLDGDRPLITITNNNGKSDKRVLVVKDSFANAFNPLLSLNFKELNVIDIRHYKLASLTDFVLENDFDLVMFFYNPDMYINSSMFKFK